MLIALLWLASSASVIAATVVVTTTSDVLSACATTGAGTCSLRDAITFANTNPGDDSITFSIGAGPQTIRLSSPLPPITDTTSVQGFTQPGSDLVKIELDGSLAGPGADGLQILASRSGVSSLSIYGFDGNAIRISGGGGSIVTGCFLGVEHTGMVARRNGGAGVLISGSAKNWIGFPEQLGNVVAASQDGIRIEGTGSDGNILLHNYVGSNYGMNPIMGNLGAGIAVLSGVGNIIVEGGIWGSGSHGLVLGPGSSGAIVQDVAIGGPNSGPLGANAGDGILVSGSSNNLIGGDEAFFTWNIIVQNGGSGIHLANGASGNVIVGNLIGTQSIPQLYPFGNRGAGIAIDNSSNNTIGGPRGSANAIAYNGGPGIGIAGVAVGNTITQNTIFSNGGLGIDVGDDRVIPVPVLTQASSSRIDVTLEGTFAGAAGRIFTIEFFASPACHALPPSDFGEGRAFLGSIKVTSGSSTGSTKFATTLTLPIRAHDGPVFPGSPIGRSITATATDEDGTTSEFSKCLAAVPNTVQRTRPEPRPLNPRPGGL